MKRKVADRFLLAIALWCAAVAVLVAVVFTGEHQRMTNDFNVLVSENLASFTRSRQSAVWGLIGDVQNQLTGLAAMIEKTGLPPGDAWLDQYLRDLSAHNDAYDITYLDAETLRRGAQEGTNEDRRIVGELLAGRPVVSDIHASARMGDSVFAVAQPVLQGGEVAGVLRTRLNALVLTRGASSEQLFQKVYSLVVRRDGEVLYSNSDRYDSTGNLYESMVKNGLAQARAEEIARRFQRADAAAFSFEGKGNTYFLSFRSLGYNGWYLVDFVRAPDVLLRADTILTNVILYSVLLILLTALSGGLLIAWLMRQKARLDLEQQRYAALSEFTDTLLFEYDCRTDRLKFTPNVREQLEVEGTTVERASVSGGMAALVHPDDRAAVALDRLPEQLDGKVRAIEARFLAKGGAYRWFECKYKVLPTRAYGPARVIGKLNDITQRREREQVLQRQAQRDALTGLYNKAGAQVMEDMLRNTGAGLLFMIDLDGFKQVNDTCGHTAGDALLTRFAAELQRIFRPGDLLARIGGDEFAALIAGAVSAETAAAKARMICARTGEIEVEGADVRLSASVGIAACPADGADYAALYAAADEAMYRAKRAGKGGFAFYADEGG